ncbi:MAG: hypothetical protein ABIJ91_02670 [Candidatus Kuenenbacteria bacterium]
MRQKTNMPRLEDEKIIQKIIQDDFEVKTMPQRFLSLRPSNLRGSKKLAGMKKTIIIGAIIIIVLAALMLSAAWLFLRSLEESKPSPSAQIQVQDTAGKDIIKADENKDNQTAVEDMLNTDNWIDFDGDFYQLKYPASWTKTEQVGENGLPLISFDDPHKTDSFKISIFSLDAYNLLEDWLGENVSYTGKPESFILDDYPSLRYSYDSGGGSIYTLNNKKVFNIEFSKPSSETILNMYDQVLVGISFAEKYTEEKLNEEDNEYNYDDYYKNENFSPAIDSDNDGLTDQEEELYKTNKDNPDTDGDGYNDGEEAANIYDPIRAGDAKLFNSDLMSAYNSTAFNFNLLYPLDFQIKESGNNVYFYAPTEEFIAVIIEENNDYSNIQEWYVGQFGTDGLDAQFQEIDINNTAAIKSTDGLRAYVMLDEKIYSFIYNIGLRSDANYMTTFGMMIKSFKK